MTVTMLKIFRVSENQKEWTDNWNTMARLIRDFAFQYYTHWNEKETRHCHTEDPGEAMFTVARNECKWGGEKDNEANRYVNPGRVSIEGDGRKKERQERHHDAVYDTGRGKGNPHAIPNFFHSGHIAELQQSVYNAGKLNLTEKRR